MFAECARQSCWCQATSLSLDLSHNTVGVLRVPALGWVPHSIHLCCPECSFFGTPEFSQLLGLCNCAFGGGHLSCWGQ